MLAIKLQRVGRKHQPSYRLVVAERRSKMAAPPVEDLGSYHPVSKATAINKDRVSYWIGMGAQPTVTVHNLLIAQGVISGKKKMVKMEKPAKPEAPAAETPAAATVAEAPVVAETAPVVEAAAPAEAESNPEAAN